MEYTYKDVLIPMFSVEISTWNPGDGISRLLETNEFGNLEFIDLSTICTEYEKVVYNQICG